MDSEWEAEAHEEPGVRTWRVLAFVGGFLAFTALLMGGLAVYYRVILAAHRVEIALRAFPAPQLQPNPTQDYVNFRKAQVAALDRSGAAPGGSQGMPIEDAMAAVTARGPQAYDPPAGPPPAAPALATGAAMDGFPRTTRSQPVAPYGMTP